MFLSKQELTSEEERDSKFRKVHVSSKLIGDSQKPHLEINLLSGTNLPVRDANGFSDPYGVFSIQNATVKSGYKTKTLNPIWNELCLLEVNPEASGMKTLEVNIWDFDYLKAPDHMGVVFVTLPDRLCRDRCYKFENIVLKTQENDGKALISFTVTPRWFAGKIVGLFGISEAGKTTLVKHLASKLCDDDTLRAWRNPCVGDIFRMTSWVLENLQDAKQELKDPKANLYAGMINSIDNLTTELWPIGVKLHGLSSSLINLWKDPALLATFKWMKQTSAVPFGDNFEKLVQPDTLERFRTDEDLEFLIEPLARFSSIVERGLSETLTLPWNSQTVEKDFEALIALIERKGAKMTQLIAKCPDLDSLAKFYLVNYKSFPPMEKTLKKTYTPTTQDLLFASHGTSGLFETPSFETPLGGIMFLETEGRKFGRRKVGSYMRQRPSQPEMILYIVDLTSYSIYTSEERTMTQDLDAFKESCSLFKFDTPYVLYFSKLDLFVEQIKTQPLQKVFNDFKGGSYINALKFIVDKYKAIFPGKQSNLHIKIGSLIDYEHVDHLLNLLAKHLYGKFAKSFSFRDLKSALDYSYLRDDEIAKVSNYDGTTICQNCGENTCNIILDPCQHVFCNDCFGLMIPIPICPSCDHKYEKFSTIDKKYTLSL